ncbi:MAG: DUF5060 domain-containing protein [Kiritimatiellae bacterium]|nr:DUF5060 domain-containing protein [Kiritimatiellia bacterium]
MRLRQTSLFAALLAVLAFSRPAAAAEWLFSAPPSAQTEVDINKDLRPFTAIEVDVKLLQTTGNEKLHCTLFFQTKDDLWFESRRNIKLSKESQTVRLRLDSGSPDWRCCNARRSFGPDVLRWVRSWGIKIFSRTPATGKLIYSSIRLIKQEDAPAPIAIFDMQRPDVITTDRVNQICFRIDGFTGRFFRTSDISGHLLCVRNGSETRVPAYFRQNYIRTKHPGTGVTTLEPIDAPLWQADWKPSKQGKYQLSLHVKSGKTEIKEDLGAVMVKVGKEEIKTSATQEQKTKDAAFIDTCTAGSNYQYNNEHWGYPVVDDGSGKHWRVHLDWTSKWGHYTGLGNFDQTLAWRFEENLHKNTDSRSLPILIFTEDVLDNQGIFNWVDNPLNATNGGSLKLPTDVFTDSVASDIVLDRARYLWSRYGQHDNVSGLLLLLDRAEPDAVKFITDIASTLSEKLPGIPVFCNSHGLPERWRSRRLELYNKWETDERLSINTHTEVDEKKKELDVYASYTHTVAVITRQTHHLADGAALTLDVQTDVGPYGELKVMCFFRTDPGIVFESELVPLRKDIWNRITFRINDPDAWKCIQDKDRKLTPYELMTVREMGLRFFCKGRLRIPVKIKNCILHGAYTIDHAEEPPFAIANLKGVPETVVQYDKLELDFQLKRKFRNPYDPEEIDVSIVLTDPTGKTLQHPGYFHEPWVLKIIDEKETPVREGKPSWRIRFAPWRQGEYKWTLTAKTGDEKAVMKGSFVCTPAKTPGFVHLSKRDPRYMEFSNGDFYYPIGHNLRSPSDRRPNIYGADVTANLNRAERQGTRIYAEWFKKMHAHDENFSRVWMSPWWCGLEWNRDSTGFHGTGYYNQANAACLDRILELAEKEHIYLNLETANHGMFSTFIDKQWRHNPLNKANKGGFLSFATQFFTDKRAKKTHENKLRYTIARWGYSTAIAWWGIMTEAEWTEPYYRGLDHVKLNKLDVAPWVPRPYKTKKHKEDLLQWIVDMDQFIRRTDAHPHLVSSHFSNPQNGTELWRRDGNDIVHNNAYTSFTEYWKKNMFIGSKGCADVIYVFCNTYNTYAKRKPLLIGEWAGNPHKNTESHLSAELHTGTWAMLMTRAAGTTGYWWWNLLDAKNLYPDFQAAAAFMKGEDRREKKYLSKRADISFPNNIDIIEQPQETEHRHMDTPAKKHKIVISHSRSGLILYNSHELFAYIYTDAINRNKNSLLATGHDDKAFPKSGKGWLNLPGKLTNGAYRLEYWNTFSGEIIDTTEVSVSDKQRRIPVISHRVDLALKLKRKE